MNHEEVGRFWNENAEVWTELVRAGYDHYRDGLNTPAFFEMLPDVEGLYGLDVGCGEGHNTRLLAERCARIAGIDISETFIRHAKEAEAVHPLGIDYRLASAVDLPFDEARFDFVAAFMSLMDIPETERVLAEVYRVLGPGGFFQFSIAHPCFDTPHRRNLRDESGYTYAIEVGDYFVGREGEEWLFSAATPDVREGMAPFRTPIFMRTLSSWLNRLVEAGFSFWSASANRIRMTKPSGSVLDCRARRLWLTSCTSGRGNRRSHGANRSQLPPARVARSGRNGRRT